MRDCPICGSLVEDDGAIEDALTQDDLIIEGITAERDRLRATIERVEELARRYEVQAVRTDEFGGPMPPAWVAAAIRAALCGMVKDV